MATWNMTRNHNITEVGIIEVYRQALIWLKNQLVAAGWDLRGTGDGIDDSLMLAQSAPGPVGTDYWDLLTNVGQGMWAVLRHPTNGGDILLHHSGGNAWVDLYWSPGSGYTNDGGITFDVPPAAPVDQRSCFDAGENAFAWATTTYYQLGITDDGESFVLFVKSGASNKTAMMFMKLDDAHTGDAQPYWCYFRGYTDAWSEDQLIAHNEQGMPWENGTIRVCVPSFYAISTGTTAANAMDDLPADPISGDQKMLRVPIYHYDQPFRQIRGVVPDLYRVSSLLADGDRLNTGDSVVIGDYAVPWGSAVDILQG